MASGSAGFGARAPALLSLACLGGGSVASRDRTIEGDVGDAQRRRCPVEGNHGGIVLLVEGQNRYQDLGFPCHLGEGFGEGRPDRVVYKPTAQLFCCGVH